MRKLFVVGIVSVVVLIAWLLFLNLDMKRFESETSVDPVPQQDSKNGSNKGFVQNENTHEPLENAEKSIQSTESPESVTPVNNTDTDKGDTASVVNPDDPQQTPTDTGLSPTDTGLSPETIKLYKDYRSIAKEMKKYNTEQYLPMQNHYSTLTERRKEIHNQLVNDILDRATTIAMYKELDEIRAWNDENLTSMFELQGIVHQIEEKRLTLLKENGYPSYDEFSTVHGKTYRTWESEQTNE